MSPLSPATPYLDLPLLAPAQAMKHITVNEGLTRLDLVSHLTVSLTADSPPQAPTPSMRVRVGTNPQGEFDGHQNAIAAWGGSDTGWRFTQPESGWRCYDCAAAGLYVFDENDWFVLRDPKPDSFAVNTPIDPNNRLSVRSETVLFDQESGNIRLSINRAGSENVGSIVFQTQYAGEIEIGLNGESGFSIRTSLDGQNWNDALTVNQLTGDVNISAGLTQGGKPVLNSDDADQILSFKGEIPAEADLDLYRTTGLFAQRSTSNAYSGTHYPIAFAGLLQVVEVNNMTFQTYHVFGLAGADGDRIYRRSRYNSTWSDWTS